MKKLLLSVLPMIMLFIGCDIDPLSWTNDPQFDPSYDNHNDYYDYNNYNNSSNISPTKVLIVRLLFDRMLNQYIFNYNYNYFFLIFCRRNAFFIVGISGCFKNKSKITCWSREFRRIF